MHNCRTSRQSHPSVPYISSCVDIVIREHGLPFPIFLPPSGYFPPIRFFLFAINLFHVWSLADSLTACAAAAYSGHVYMIEQVALSSLSTLVLQNDFHDKELTSFVAVPHVCSRRTVMACVIQWSSRSLSKVPKNRIVFLYCLAFQPSSGARER